MDFGYFHGNRVVIPLKAETEHDLLLFLYNHYTAREYLLDIAESIRTVWHDCIWLDHPALFFPFPIRSFTTNKMFQQDIHERISSTVPILQARL